MQFYSKQLVASQRKGGKSMFKTAGSRIGLVLLGAVCLTLVSAWAQAGGQDKIRVLIIDGQNNHNWKATTPVMKQALEDCGRFTVDVATAPTKPNSPKKPEAPKKPDEPKKPKETDEASLKKYELAK